MGPAAAWPAPERAGTRHLAQVTHADRLPTRGMPTHGHTALARALQPNPDYAEMGENREEEEDRCEANALLGGRLFLHC